MPNNYYAFKKSVKLKEKILDALIRHKMLALKFSCHKLPKNLKLIILEGRRLTKATRMHTK